MLVQPGQPSAHRAVHLIFSGEKVRPDDNPEVLKVMPFLKATADVERVPRPSRQTGEQYNQASNAVFQGVSQILGGTDAAQVLPQLEQRLQKLIA